MKKRDLKELTLDHERIEKLPIETQMDECRDWALAAVRVVRVDERFVPMLIVYGEGKRPESVLIPLPHRMVGNVAVSSFNEFRREGFTHCTLLVHGEIEHGGRDREVLEELRLYPEYQARTYHLLNADGTSTPLPEEAVEAVGEA